MSSLFRKVVTTLTLPCEEHQRLSATAYDRPLARSERMAVWGHRLACRPCRRLVRHLTKLESVGQSMRSQAESQGLGEERRRRIAEALADRSK